MVKRVTNYFKGPREQYFCFIDRVPNSIESAYAAAVLAAGPEETISVYHATIHAGPWDRLPIIGHRARKDIWQDLGAVIADADERERLLSELYAVDAAFAEVGRSTPLQAVA